jgi:putative FmdB family regulatory protein
MPAYDYVCSDCGHAFEALVRGPRARPACDRCGSRKASRQPALVSTRRESGDAPAIPCNGKPAMGCGLIERPPPCGHCE